MSNRLKVSVEACADRMTPEMLVHWRKLAALPMSLATERKLIALLLRIVKEQQAHRRFLATDPQDMTRH